MKVKTQLRINTRTSNHGHLGRIRGRVPPHKINGGSKQAKKERGVGLTKAELLSIDVPLHGVLISLIDDGNKSNPSVCPRLALVGTRPRWYCQADAKPLIEKRTIGGKRY